MATDNATISVGDCNQVLGGLDDSSIHMVLTDPPYFLDGLDDTWRKGNDRKRNGTVGGLPVGMKFDPRQGVQLQKFMSPISEQLFRVLKPGGFALIFSAPRLIHRMAVAVEDAGFEIRDLYAWRFTRKAQFKAFSMNHFVEKRKDLSKSEKADVVKRLDGRKTPQLRPEFETILCAQKPKEGTCVDNWLEHETGLIDASQGLGGKCPSTVMTVEKPDREKYNCHLTAKPVPLCEHLIQLFTCTGQTVLDPFMGSGTTCVAAERTNRRSIGIDINPDYIHIAKQRLEEARI